MRHFLATALLAVSLHAQGFMPGGGGSVAAPPTYEENFQEYTTTAHLVSDPPTPDDSFWTSIDSLAPGQITLDATHADSALGYTQSMHYAYPAGAGQGGTEYTIQRGYFMFPPYRRTGTAANVGNLWVEVLAKFSTTFTVLNPNCGCGGVNADFKYIFIGANTYGGGLLSDRAELRVGTTNGFGNWWGPLVPGRLEDAPGWDMFLPGSSGTTGVFDGAWHSYRFHILVPTSRTSNDGRYTVWLDGVVMLDSTNIQTSNPPSSCSLSTQCNNNPATGYYGVVLGQNLNQGVYQNMDIWWQRIRVWLTNPGW